jgi:ubiquinone/menaquinone biosynthesis C-methylase UbiE
MELSDPVERIIKYWNDYAPQFDEAHATENLNNWRKMLKKFIGEGKKSVLDLGTGTGFLAKMAAELGYESSGVDLSQEMMDLGREAVKQKGLAVAFIEAPVEKLPFADNSFDALINCRLIWTLVEPKTAFTEWLRVLKKGGQVLNFIRIKDGKDTEIKEIYGEELDRSLPLKNAGKDAMTAALEGAGFINCEAILLPADLTFAPDMNPWYAIKGIKAN